MVMGERIPSEVVHHTKGRAGRFLNDQRYWLPLSQKWHDWIHQSGEGQAWAKENGYVLEYGGTRKEEYEAKTIELRLKGSMEWPT